VTSINAGLAVPDWPTSFDSYDPFNPWPEWWKLTPVLAEHGHRLLGALTGLFTLILAVWTWVYDARRWMRVLASGALVLVTFQGVLGGLRVVLISLDLAVVHACVAQVFFALIVGMVLFTSRTWLTTDPGSYDSQRVTRLRAASLVTAAVLYIQIILGALLRHPGIGIDPFLAAFHIAGAVAAGLAIVLLYSFVRRYFRGTRIAAKAANVLLLLLVVQITLGITAYVVTINDAGILEPSNLQVVVNTSHMVTGALLMGACSALVLDAFRLPRTSAAHVRASADNSVILSETTTIL
jgi:cytochrome c oxidase assembly protein subunit 15